MKLNAKLEGPIPNLCNLMYYFEQFFLIIYTFWTVEKVDYAARGADFQLLFHLWEMCLLPKKGRQRQVQEPIKNVTWWEQVLMSTVNRSTSTPPFVTSAIRSPRTAYWRVVYCFRFCLCADVAILLPFWKIRLD